MTHLTPERASTLPYILVYLALMALLALTVLAAFLPLGRIALTISLSIALAKAILIVLHFMHVKNASSRVALFATAGFVWLAILLSLTLTDYLTRNHPAGASPKGEPRFLSTPNPPANQ